MDYPVTDILQMIGRANRPLIDDSGEWSDDTQMVVWVEDGVDDVPYWVSLQTTLY